MKINAKLTAAMFCIATASSVLQAQEEQQQDLRGEGGQVHQTLVPQSEGTELINAPDSISLEQTAVNKPSELTGLPVTDSIGRAIGEVDRIVRRISDNVLHAVVRSEDEPLMATVLDDFNIGAFALWNPDGDALPDTAYEPADYEVVDQHQVGHSAFGSLSDPSGDARGSPAYSRTPEPADQQVAADAAVLQGAEPAATAPGLTGGSSLVQMALTQSDQMKGIPLTSATGAGLGVVAEILRNTRDGMLYALINTPEGSQPAVVSLEALKIGRLVLDAERDDLQEQSFDDINFREVQER